MIANSRKDLILHKVRVGAYWVLVAVIVLSMYGVAQQNAYAEGTVPTNATTAYPGLDPRLIGVPIVKTNTTAALVAYSQAVDKVNNLESEKANLAQNIAILTPELARAQEIAQQRADEYTQIDTALQSLVVAQYESIPSGSDDTNSLDIDKLRGTQQSTSAAASLRLTKKKALKRKDHADKYLLDVTNGLTNAQQRNATIDGEIKTAKKAAKDTRNIVKSGIPIAIIEGLEIPVLSMDAYLRAEKVLAETKPECSLPWWAIAGIGRAESNHGQFRGAILDQNGTVTPPIIGVPLNGNGVAAIGDSDGGKYDGDLEWDRAVGVTQFIPGTWNRWASDGNGDGLTDPQNVYDAALATAKKLCADAQPNMATPEGRRSAYLSYNHSGSYADFVEAKGKDYERIGAGRFNPIPVDATVPAQ